MPRFTFHGFQYVEVTGLNAFPDFETITGIPLSTDTPLAGSFECSDELTNKLARNLNPMNCAVNSWRYSPRWGRKVESCRPTRA